MISCQKYVLIAIAALFLLGGCVAKHRQLPTALNEVSGAVQIDSGSTYLLINDSGNDPLVFSYNTCTGNLDTLYRLPANTDYEAMASRKTPAGEEICVCDIGDNRRARPQLTLYTISNGAHQTHHVRYPKGQHDAEACFYRGENLFILTKPRTGRRRVQRWSYLYAWEPPARTLVLVDSLQLKQRSITDAVMLDSSTLAFTAYEFDFLGPLPYSRTHVFSVKLDDQNHFIPQSLRKRRVTAPFTLTQYEAIAPAPHGDGLLIFSERTAGIPARWRRIKRPKKRVSPE